MEKSHKERGEIWLFSSGGEKARSNIGGADLALESTALLTASVFLIIFFAYFFRFPARDNVLQDAEPILQRSASWRNSAAIDTEAAYSSTEYVVKYLGGKIPLL